MADKTEAGPIGVGDIVVIGLNGDGDTFAWAPLINLEAGDTFILSDIGWNSSTGDFANAGGATESTVTFTASTDIAAGTVTVESSLALSFNGDQVVIYTDDGTTTEFIFGVNSNSSEWGLVGNTITESDLYAGLTDGVNAVAAGKRPLPGEEWDNIVYTGTTTGTMAEILAAVSDDTNWMGSNDPVDLSSNFDVDFDVTDAPPLGGNGDPTNVPEPTTLLVLGCGALGLLGYRRIRGKQRPT